MPLPPSEITHFHLHVACLMFDQPEEQSSLEWNERMPKLQ